ncbi:MAG TPA: aminotransferase class I/II-fold pyridoxal phosphate-dependent enzyme [Candidatus Obscuribacterales bacterium]
MQTKVPELAGYLESRALSLEELNALVEALDTVDSRPQACAMLHELAARLEERKGHEGLRLLRMEVPGCEEPIRLILHPATFEPEQWGRTFAEGLLKEPEVFKGQSVVELGAGTGWISILLLKRTLARNVLGLDLNPIAVAIARLNTWLNGSDAQGNLLTTAFGAPLVEAFRVAVSDLLQEPLARDERFDHVIGCIPQVLHPHGESVKDKKGLSTRDLYDLSNYCFEQGILEDRFGLPLIARALEQAQLCLNAGGLLTLIFGGRPGLEAIDGVFRRRGYEPTLRWSRRIQQADDTDIASLVALEKAYGIKFHFYTSYSSTQSIPAATAMRWLEKGRMLYHDLLVMQARTRFERPMLSFVRNLNTLGLGEMRREIDLSNVSEEQISFLARLTQEFLGRKTVPYPHERGDLSLRTKISRFLKTYCGLSVKPQELFVGPERMQLVHSILSMVLQPGDQVLLSGSLQSVYRGIFSSIECSPISGNDDLAELMALDDLFAPKICLLAPYEMDNPSPLVLQTFIRQAEAHPDRWYVIDDSDNFDIGSQLKSNVMMRLLGEQTLPPNLVFLYGLIKNTVCPDLELSFAINLPDLWIEGLDVAAELSYSRIPYPAQLYYEWLFDDLLSFPFPDSGANKELGRFCPVAQVSDWFKSVASDPAFAPKPIDPEDADVLRFDYGEFEAPVPNALLRGLIKGFLEPVKSGLPEVVKSRIAAYVDFTRGVKVSESRIALGQGAFPLLGNLVRVLRKRLGRTPVVAMPRGSYGLVYSLVAYHGGRCVLIDTEAEQGFPITVQALAKSPEKVDLLWLTQPNNPSGLFFEHDTVAGIMQLCAQQGIYVLADEIFFLLSDPQLGSWTDPQLSFAAFLNRPEAKWLFVCDGLAKGFAAGGIRDGFMACPDEHWADELQAITLMPPSVCLRAWDGLYSVFLDKAPHPMMDLAKELAEVEEYLLSMRRRLHDQRERVLAVLRSHGLGDRLDSAKRGGLFVLGKFDEKMCTDLARQQKLLLNPPKWARTPGWARLCFSLEPDRFDRAMQRLQHFLTQ